MCILYCKIEKYPSQSDNLTQLIKNRTYQEWIMMFPKLRSNGPLMTHIQTPLVRIAKAEEK